MKTISVRRILCYINGEKGSEMKYQMCAKKLMVGHINESATVGPCVIKKLHSMYSLKTR